MFSVYTEFPLESLVLKEIRYMISSKFATTSPAVKLTTCYHNHYDVIEDSN